MRRGFKKHDHYAEGQSVEWLNGSHWRPGTVVGPLAIDTLGYAYYPVRNDAATTRTVSRGAVVRGYAGKIRRAV